ncbi:flagellar hook assembly protein FlgD [Methylomarinum sp. Ch1-1]|uniref:Basal-body rod modification protein FlgD n=1 Tax=Methylomarinum roseum TaxID=3067653 RepID=A0AAU7NUE6_9GAMM|nr:flagellar hook assembly protein FlgD [Methylomarinum sp. Ch1-1]MDP4519274.1 flagellar hook assembly protein FlgD [Methylomarinum sp. Ch1-1]
MAINALETFKDLGLSTIEKAKKEDQSLQQEQFLELLTTQLTHQDPLKPMENGEFLGQMAQFSTVSGIQDLQASFKDFASSISSDQALQAASLVGRYVSAPATEGLLSAGGTISGEFELPSNATEVNLKVTDSLSGEVVRSIDLGNQSAGDVAFAWDGMTAEGEFADPGVYKVQVEAKIDGNNTVLQTQIKSKVESVTMANSNRGLQVNLAGIGPVNFNQIKQIL